MTRRRTPEQMRRDALAIWQAGVAAVASDRLVRDNVSVDGSLLRLVEEQVPLGQIRRICVVGGGKAGAGMAAGLESALGDEILQTKEVTGWVNVPADCVRQLRRITLHAARPAGVNEPTAEGVFGCRQILERVESLTPQDLCICLLSGGGSALLPAPAEGVTLADKQAVTKHLSAAGANISQLNTVRKQLSRVKGGGLAHACRAGRLITLIISDVLGDPLDVIASGPTVANSTTAQDALDVLRQFPSHDGRVSDAVWNCLQQRADAERKAGRATRAWQPSGQLAHFVIGNNAFAVDAAGVEAERRGYSHAMIAARTLEGEAESVGRHLAHMARQMRDHAGPDCLISGGEPTVRLVDAARRGQGGRNQQLVLAALLELAKRSSPGCGSPLQGMLVLSGGTDGEDGPTDAAGALADQALLDAATAQQLDGADYLQRNDAYHFFAPLGGLIKTGPTHTNVCDVRVVLVDRQAE